MNADKGVCYDVLFLSCYSGAQLLRVRACLARCASGRLPAAGHASVLNLQSVCCSSLHGQTHTYLCRSARAARCAPQQDGVRVTRPLGLLAERRMEQLCTAGILCTTRGAYTSAKALQQGQKQQQHG